MPYLLIDVLFYVNNQGLTSSLTCGMLVQTVEKS